jgi:hypothetical protein
LEDFVNRPTTLRGCLVILVAVLVCVGTGVFAVDRYCLSALNWRIPVYPNAVLVSQQPTLLSANGMGQTVNIYRAAAPQTEVSAWYNRAIGSKAVEASKRDDLTGYYRYTGVSYTVNTASDDANASQIVLVSSCFSSAYR